MRERENAEKGGDGERSRRCMREIKEGRQCEEEYVGTSTLKKREIEDEEGEEKEHKEGGRKMLLELRMVKESG